MLALALGAAGCAGSSEAETRGTQKTDQQESKSSRQRVERPANVQRASLAFRVAVESPTAETEEVAGRDGEPLILLREPLVTERDIRMVEVGPGMDPRTHAVFLHFTPQAAARLREATPRHVGRTLAILVDGEVVVSPRIQGDFSSEAALENRYTRDEALRIAQRLAP